MKRVEGSRNAVEYSQLSGKSLTQGFKTYLAERLITILSLCFFL